MESTYRFLLRRFIIILVNLAVLTVIAFGITMIFREDFLQLLFRRGTEIEEIEWIRQEAGFNDSWLTQYFTWLRFAFQGNFGNSIRFQMPVLELVQQRMYTTLTLAISATFLLYIIGIPLGIISGRYKESWKDSLISIFTYLSLSIPHFILATLLLFIFGFKLGWVPTTGSVAPGMSSGDWAYMTSRIHHVLMPAIALMLFFVAKTIQYLRNEIIDLESQNFVALARAKGASEGRIFSKHIFRNAMVPLSTSFSLDFVELLGATIFVEMVFSYPGIGQLLLVSMDTQDNNVIILLVLVFGTLTILGSFIGDLFLVSIDPRIKIK